MELEAVTDNVFLVRGKNNGNFPYSHSILVLDEDTVMIDTGCGVEVLESLKRKYNVTSVINSHTHPDHSAGNWIFKDSPIHVPQEGFDTSGRVVALSKRFVTEELSRIWQEWVTRRMGFKDCEPTHSYGEEPRLDFGETMLTPLHTPGHTKDHYCFYEQGESILFSFDYDLTSFPWYGHRESSLSDFCESVDKLKALSPEIVVSSHRGIISQNVDAEFDRFSRILLKRDEKILSLLESEKTLDQLADHSPIYGSFPYAKDLLRYWEKEMIKKHLEQLESEGRVEMLPNSGHYKSVR